MNSTDVDVSYLGALIAQQMRVEKKIQKLVDKYLTTEMPAATFMSKQTPLLIQRSVLVAKIRVSSEKLTVENECVPDCQDDTKPDNSSN